MAENIIPANSGPSSATFEPVPVEGWASDSWGFGDEPAVVINPGATGLKLLAWGMGQLEQIERVMSVITCSQSDVVVDPADVVGPLHHQLSQVLAVLSEATERLRREKDEAEATEVRHD